MPDVDVPRQRPVPLSLAQQAALLPERLRRSDTGDGPPVTPNLFSAMEITGELDPGALDRSAVALLDAQEILRSVFPDDRRMPYQTVLSTPDSVVEVIEGITGDVELFAALVADAEHRFDLVRQRPIRLRLYRLPARAVLSVTVHQVAADDQALDLLVTGLFAGYGGEPVAASGHYRDFAAAQVRGLSAAAADPAIAFWTEQLADAPEPVPVAAVGAGGGISRRTLTLSSDTVAALAGDAEPSAALLALAAAALRDAGLGDDVVIGLIDPARTPESAGVIGNFANRLAIRVDLADRTAGQLIDATAHVLSRARAHAGPRIEHLTHLTGGGPLFQAQLQVRSAGPLVLDFEAGAAREIARQVARPHDVDIVFDVVPASGGAVTIEITFPRQFAGRPEIEHFADGFAARAGAWAADPGTGIGDADDSMPLFASAEFEFGMLTSGLGGPPSTAAETTVAEAIRTVLALTDDDEIGRDDTFFSLGGDSIAALRLATLLGEQGFALDVKTVFSAPAIHELARQLDAAPPTAAIAPVPAIEPMGASGLDAATLAALGNRFSAAKFGTATSSAE
ncbi:condensation domain-containing protein [Nocardia sp. NPDC055321]